MQKILLTLFLMLLCSCAERAAEKKAIAIFDETPNTTEGLEHKESEMLKGDTDIPLGTFGEDSSYKELLKLKSKQGKLADCEFAVRNAKKDFENGIYAFHSRPGSPVECTFCDVLRMDYKIWWYFIDDTFSDKYWDCYDSTLTVGLKEKYGKDFLQRAREKADSLDRKGNWNSEPSFKGGSKKLKSYLRNVSERVSSVLKEPTDSTMMVVNFRVGTSGDVTNPKILKGVNKEVDSIALGIVDQMPNWNPAYRQGRPTPMSYALLFKVGKGKTTPANPVEQ